MFVRRDLASIVTTPLLGALLALTMLIPTSSGSSVAPAIELKSYQTVGVAYYTTATYMQRLLNRCDGPVMVRFDGIRPRLLAEHDYCGGRWVLGLERGDIVRLSNGNYAGRYKVNGNIKVVRKGTSAGVLRGMGSVVAQTCRPDGDTLRLVGLTRVD